MEEEFLYMHCVKPTRLGTLVTCGGHDDVECFYWLQPLRGCRA